jgi:hypothetical protein
MGRRLRSEETRMKAFTALKDAIAEELIDDLPPVLNIRDLQAVAGTSASYLRSSLIAGRLTGQQIDDRWVLQRDDNRVFIKRRILKMMNLREKPTQPAALPEALCPECSSRSLQA